MAPRTEMARQVSLSGCDVHLFASLGRMDDYLEMELPGEAYSSGLLAGLERLPADLDGDRLDWRARDGDPPILSFMLLRSSSRQPPAAAPVRLGRLLSEIARQAPGFEFGDLAFQPPAVSPIPGPAPVAPAPETTSQAKEPVSTTLSEPDTPTPLRSDHPEIAVHHPAWLMDRASVTMAMEHARRGQTHRALRILDEVLGRTPGQPGGSPAEGIR